MTITRHTVESNNILLHYLIEFTDEWNGKIEENVQELKVDVCGSREREKIVALRTKNTNSRQTEKSYNTSK